MIFRPFRLPALVALLALNSCVTPTTAPHSSETIAIEVGPCFGFCPVYELSVTPGGAVHFDGQRHTAILGEESRRVSGAVYRSIAQNLAPYRPASGSDVVVECTAAVSDTSSYKIVWTDTSGRRTIATVQSGCPGGPGETLVKFLRDVPAQLGADAWVKQVTRPGASRG